MKSVLKSLSIKHLFLFGFLGLYTKFYLTNDLLTILFAISTTCSYFWMEWQDKTVIKNLQEEELKVIKNELSEVKAALGVRSMKRF